MPSIPAAPLDPAQVALSLAPFGSSRMLPRDSYLSPTSSSGSAATSSTAGCAWAGPRRSRRAGSGPSRSGTTAYS